MQQMPAKAFWQAWKSLYQQKTMYQLFSPNQKNFTLSTSSFREGGDLEKKCPIVPKVPAQSMDAANAKNISAQKVRPTGKSITSYCVLIP